MRFSADWFQRAIGEKSLVVCRREGKIIGYVLGTSFGLKDPVAIIQSMLCAFPVPADKSLVLLTAKVCSMLP